MGELLRRCSVAFGDHNREAVEQTRDYSRPPTVNMVQYSNGGSELRGDGMSVPYPDRKSTRLNSSHIQKSRMPSSA